MTHQPLRSGFGASPIWEIGGLLTWVFGLVVMCAAVSHSPLYGGIWIGTSLVSLLYGVWGCARDVLVYRYLSMWSVAAIAFAMLSPLIPLVGLAWWLGRRSGENAIKEIQDGN